MEQYHRSSNLILSENGEFFKNILYFANKCIIIIEAMIHLDVNLKNGDSVSSR